MNLLITGVKPDTLCAQRPYSPMMLSQSPHMHKESTHPGCQISYLMCTKNLHTSGVKQVTLCACLNSLLNAQTLLTTSLKPVTL